MFLHADSHLPVDAKWLIECALADPEVAGGQFDLQFDRPSMWGRIISLFMNLRSRLSRISTGDQAMFVRRHVFQQLGGFPDIPIMEDIEFSARLKRTGRTVALRGFVTTSFRRWERRPFANDPLDVGFAFPVLDRHQSPPTGETLCRCEMSNGTMKPHAHTPPTGPHGIGHLR